MANLVKQHSAIVGAIEEGNAEAAMRAHLKAITDELPLIAAEHPEHFQDQILENCTNKKIS